MYSPMKSYMEYINRMKLRILSSHQLKPCMLHRSCKVSRAIEILQESPIKICLVIDDCERLVGTVSDGDVRRGLLKGITLETDIEVIMHSRPWWISEMNAPTEALTRDMQEKNISIVPILNASRKVVGAAVAGHHSIPVENEILIMAGGFGKRLLPFTKDVPKPMVEVNGKPMLEHIIRKAAAEGFVNFVISVFYLSEVIENYFGSGERFGVKIRYLRESNPLGTGGSLALMRPFPTKPFLVTNGDVMTDVRFDEILNYHKTSGAIGTMVIKQHHITNPFGVVSLEGDKVTSFEEKPTYVSHINAGIYALNPEIIDYLQPSEVLGMPTLLERCIHAGKAICAYPLHERWSDVGRPEDLRALNGSDAD